MKTEKSLIPGSVLCYSNSFSELALIWLKFYAEEDYTVKFKNIFSKPYLLISKKK